MTNTTFGLQFPTTLLRSMLHFLLIISFLLISSMGFAQKKPAMFDVYKMDYVQYREGRPDNNVVDPAFIPAKPTLELFTISVFASKDHLLAIDRYSKKDSTVWLVHNPKKELWELRGKMALPLNYEEYLPANVFREDETADTTLKDYGILKFSADTLTLNGYLCKKATIEVAGTNVSPEEAKRFIHIWYCPDLPAFRWPTMNHLQKIPGAFLMTKLDIGWGPVECMKIRKITKLKKPATFFDIPKGMDILYPPAAN